MSYCSRVYRHRNAHTNDEAEKQPFFSKQHDVNKSNQRSAFFQPKLLVNAPGDVYEREADSVANAVVNHSANTPVVQQKKISAVQQMSNADEKKDKLKGVQKMDKPKEKEKKKTPVQQMSNPDEKKDKLKGIQKKDEHKEEDKKKMPVQTKQEAGATTATPQVASAIEQSSGKGNALSKNALNEMNSSFGVDFSNVRIHNDNEAAAINQELNAQAFTHGNDIYFNKGKYNPDNAQGKFLLAHELTHVVQQNDSLQRKTVQRRVVDSHVVTNDAMQTTLNLSREEIIAAIAAADADAIVLAQNAEDVLTAQLANATNGDAVDADAELILNEELGLSYNNPAHHGLIRQQIRRFRTVKETLQSGYLRYFALGLGNIPLIGCDPNDSTCGEDFAFSCPGNRLIVLCQSFWDTPDEQSATVLHEPFHIWFDMARHDTGALRRADASCFESFALRASGRGAFASCDTHTAG